MGYRCNIRKEGGVIGIKGQLVMQVATKVT